MDNGKNATLYGGINNPGPNANKAFRAFGDVTGAGLGVGVCSGVKVGGSREQSGWRLGLGAGWKMCHPVRSQRGLSSLRGRDT